MFTHDLCPMLYGHRPVCTGGWNPSSCRKATLNGVDSLLVIVHSNNYLLELIINDKIAKEKLKF